MLQIENPITTAFEHLQFIVQPFDKPAVAALNEKVEDFPPPALQCFEESIKAFQLAGHYTLLPGLDFDLGGCFGNRLFKDGR